MHSVYQENETTFVSFKPKPKREEVNSLSKNNSIIIDMFCPDAI